MPIAGSTRRPGQWTLAFFWLVTLALLLGCSEVADPMDARFLRRQFPEQAEAILRGPFAFALADDGFEAPRALDVPAGRAGEGGPRSRFPRGGDGVVRFPLPDGSEALVRELGAAGAGELAEGAVTYSRAGGASFWTALEDGYEEWLLLEPRAVRRDAPVASWQVDGAALRQDGEAVALADARGATQIRVTAPEAYAAGGRPVGARLIARGERIELWVEAEGETVLVDPRWRLGRKMSAPHYRHTATLLPDGRVLVAGGGYRLADASDSAEIFDPASGQWSVHGSTNTARANHTATLLPDGRVLVAGGEGPDGALDSTEVFDPKAGQGGRWSTGKPMRAARADHTATLLPDGGVLVAGGEGPDGALDSAEIYDPAADAWFALAPMLTARTAHTATLLPNGQVLVAGGEGPDGALDSAEIYDPAADAWIPRSPMLTARTAHTATLLPNGQVLVAGGEGPDGALNAAELFNATSDTWRAAGSMAAARRDHAATPLLDGRVLVIGGGGLGGSIDGAEVFDPEAREWRSLQSMQRSRAEHTATLLPDGQVLVAGGSELDADGSLRAAIDDAELLDPDAGMWPSLDRLRTARYSHTATLLPDGRVLVAGGDAGDGGANPGPIVDSAEAFDPDSGTWNVVGRMEQARASHTATLLLDGRVLAAGGRSSGEIRSLSNAELFEPDSSTWRIVSAMHTARDQHTATLLDDGKVLVAGGREEGEILDSAELFDPRSETWALVAPMREPRHAHTATLLPNGQVLVAGGSGPDGVLDGAEVFDPATGGWLPLEPMIAARARHTATLLKNGRVLVAGGLDAARALDSAEVFIPDSGRWMPLGSMHTGRIAHTATLLSDGRALVVGGADMQGFALQPVEVFDPSSGTWLRLEPLPIGRYWHTATRLNDGRVLVAGGLDEGALDSVSAFRPMPDGSPCAADVECHSGYCTDGVCCERVCDVYLCEACSALRGASADGVCTSLHPDYLPFACSPQTGEQTKPCRSVRDCADGFVCDAGGECVPPPQSTAYLDKGGCHLAVATPAEPTGRVPAELGLLTLAAASAVLRRRGR
ncbi:kelch repeat-containing protein [Sorangium sp. So ce385]|uniref:kelch repeat-containing protein n=1 Tax=Sorangium sp. So ce385 TaxID=3133308 RepID=UPI003F5B9585